MFALRVGILMNVPSRGLLDSMGGQLAEACYTGGDMASGGEMMRYSPLPSMECHGAVQSWLGGGDDRIFVWHGNDGSTGVVPALAGWSIAPRLQMLSKPYSADGTESVYQRPDTPRVRSGSSTIGSV
ncbi:hypothetical protein M409DRAFT_52569 [Zasmidium cellare ATCC 36951]|uniref:Uncharacterized protein n=1 Tax=Zasmidium cellare ATCC 36951 TaxID=1080233 RepID=A0A6A6CRJ3_ZASCE|nr:uncharacterized protein M409DRAFT_52569 [Zasmidium cellare ATCC 36951]KAF2169313.1 hypothetical protein M409DRAFT_52569 [Zasmidium cellare ATCC 36951]